MKLSDLKPTIEKLCADVPVVPGYSLQNSEDEWSDHYYCYECAAKVLEWLRAGSPSGYIKPDGEHPGWASDVDAWPEPVVDGSIETETCEMCHSCDVMLEYCLVDVEQELSHFESVVSGECTRARDADGIVGPMDPGEWSEILEIIEGIEHVERDAWPYVCVQPSISKKRHREEYQRTVAMVQAALSQAGG